MPTPDQELASYKAIYQGITKTPELKEKWLKLYKEAFPDAAIPEVDVPAKLRQEFSDQIKERDTKIEELNKKLFKKEFDDKFKEDRAALAGAPWFLGEEQVKMVDDLVEKKGFPSLELAADYLRATTEPLKPSSLGLSGFAPTKSARDDRKAFNERYRKVFKKAPSKFNEVFDDAYRKAFVTGEYVKEMGQ